MDNNFDNFDWEKYINYYEDLKKCLFKKEDAIKHWINNGKNENRIYFKINDGIIDYNIFDWEKYINYYEDLKSCLFTKEDSIKHWISHGNTENRIYFKNNEGIIDYNCFDWKKYINYYEDLKKCLFTKEDAIKHWLNHGQCEERIFFIYDDKHSFKLLNNYSIIDNKLKLEPDYIDINISNKSSNRSSNIIFSLFTHPNTFVKNEFKIVIDSLYNQIYKSKYIIINIYYIDGILNNDELYKFNERIDFFKNNYDNIIINKTNIENKIARIIGIMDLDIQFNDNDKIIFIDDNCEVFDILTYYYELVYNIYNCDAVFIDEIYDIKYQNKQNININISNEIFYDNYQNFAYGSLSYSLKYKYIYELNNYYKKLIYNDNNINIYDDLIITLFYKTFNIYSCGININFNKKNNESKDLNIVRNIEYEKKIFDLNNILYKQNNDTNILQIVNSEINNSILNIDDNIPERNILFNIENISYRPDKNNFLHYHYDIKYLNINTFIFTITNFMNKLNDEEIFTFNFDNVENLIKLKITNFFSRKQSFLINLNKAEFKKINHKKYNFNVVQTYNYNKIDLNKFYTISTILNYIPDIKYKFYNEINRSKFINEEYSSGVLNIYNKIIPGAYKADLFRVLYIYKKGGLYIDCKNILYRNINNLLDNNECYVRDLGDGIYNAFIYCSYPNNNNLKEYLSAIIYNVFKSSYGTNGLDVTGPQLMIHYIRDHIYLKNTHYDMNWKRTFLTDFDNNIFIKNSYEGYYDTNDYLKKAHYTVLYDNKQIYNNIEIDYSKINEIDAILWINLERSENRREYMNELLSNINIKNIRIDAIDGKKRDNLRDLINIPFEDENLTNYEIACTLSHIKAINMIDKLEGEYFMICEDDISLENIILFNEDLNSIIKNSPEFDILLINKTYHNDLDELYTDWNKLYNMGPNFHIASAVCYIVSKNGVNKIINRMKYNNDNDFIFNSNELFNSSDKFIYRNINTYVYKYNFITYNTIESTIHNDHLEHHIKMKNRELNIIIDNKLLC